MNKRTLIAGFIVLLIGIVLNLGAEQIMSSYPNGKSLSSSASGSFAIASLIIGSLLAVSGIILLIYGAISPEPPIHYNNNLRVIHFTNYACILRVVSY